MVFIWFHFKKRNAVKKIDEKNKTYKKDTKNENGQNDKQNENKNKMSQVRKIKK